MQARRRHAIAAVRAIDRLRWAVGVRRLTDREAPIEAKKDRDGATALPQMKSYREADGKFYFKLESGDGATLLQSRGFGSPKDAGRLVAALVDAGDDAAALGALLEMRCRKMPRRTRPCRRGAGPPQGRQARTRAGPALRRRRALALRRMLDSRATGSR